MDSPRHSLTCCLDAIGWNCYREITCLDSQLFAVTANLLALNARVPSVSVFCIQRLAVGHSVIGSKPSAIGCKPIIAGIVHCQTFFSLHKWTQMKYCIVEELPFLVIALVVFWEHVPKWNRLSRQLFLHLNHLMNNDQHTLCITRYLVGAP